MDGDWEEVRSLILPSYPPSVQTFAFDTSQELLWIGTPDGRVDSYYGTELQRYTSFRCGGKEHPVRQMLFHEKGVIALTSRAVHFAMRRGPPIWHIKHQDMTDLHCMSYTSKGTSEIVVAGIQNQMFVIDVEKGTISKQIHTIHQYTMMRRCRYICAATNQSAVNFLDPITLEVVETWGLYGQVHDLDAQHDFVVASTSTTKAGAHGGQPQFQSHLNVFDLKLMKHDSKLMNQDTSKLKKHTVISIAGSVSHVRMHPRMSTTSIVLSYNGQIYTTDVTDPNAASTVKQAFSASGVIFVGMEIAPSGEAMAMRDQASCIQLWGSPSKIRFAELSNPTEFPEAEEPSVEMRWDINTPLSTAGMPYYRETLLSAWPSHMIFEVGAPPLKLVQHPSSSWRITDWGGHGPNPRTSLRNQTENTRLTEKVPAGLQTPKFLSEKARETPTDTNQERRISDVSDAVGIEPSSVHADIPVTYQNVNIKYSRFGVADFDFGYYNKTKYSGLEIHIANSYANSLLQVFNFIPMIRNLALQHTATVCTNDACLLCEMGFLFDMLEKAEGVACHATNFLKTFSHHPQAGPLGLLEEEAPGSPLTTMLQGLNRFLLDRIAQDWRSVPPYSTAVDQALQTVATTSIHCVNCRSEHTRPGTTFVNELLYPLPKPMIRNARRPKVKFSDVLKSSVEREITSRGWCSRCQRYQSLATKKTIHSVPTVLMLNAAINSPEAKQLWSSPGWLPQEIGVILNQGHFFCYQGEDLELHLQRGTYNVTVYSLVGLTAEITSAQNQRPHLVSFVNVAHSQPETPQEDQWHLFNDFLVRPIKTEEALTFNTAWKLPSVISYQIKQFNNRIDNSWKQNLDTTLLYIDTNHNLDRTYHPLIPPDEAPGEGTLIALDTEFVSVRQSEIEVNAEGELETIRPTVYALARVSVIRGTGEDEGVPFIDDYISGKEPVIDYLTSYSGIIREDLDPRISKHNLVPLKVAYKKLWILLNLGCKFLGHGLKQDFRVTNIHVPKAQVIDTSDFFYIKLYKRKLSLAFLAWYLLKEDIQVETHDSIEDARTALKLYRKYLEFQDAGILDTIVQDIYRKGKEMQFKPPPAKKDGHLIERTETPPILNESAFGNGSGSGNVGTPGPSSGPTTPVRRPAGLAPGSGLGMGPGSTFSSGWTPGKGRGSPLR